MALPRNRHDALFRMLVSDPARAAGLLGDYLPPEVAARLDPERPPVHVEGTMIDGEGSLTQSDALFRLHLGDGSAVIVYTLLEHKSQRRSPDAAPAHPVRAQDLGQGAGQRRLAGWRPAPCHCDGILITDGSRGRCPVRSRR